MNKDHDFSLELVFKGCAVKLGFLDEIDGLIGPLLLAQIHVDGAPQSLLLIDREDLLVLGLR